MNQPTKVTIKLSISTVFKNNSIFSFFVILLFVSININLFDIIIKSYYYSFLLIVFGYSKCVKFCANMR